MERLTRRMCGGWGLVEGCEINTTKGMRRIVERLAAYENTELSPEEVEKLKMPVLTIATQDEGRLREIMQAERGGRIEILPNGEVKNEPLTLNQLLGMDAEPVFVTSALGEKSMWYIVDVEDNELKNPWDRICLDDWDTGWPYTAYRCPPEGAHR